MSYVFTQHPVSDLPEWWESSSNNGFFLIGPAPNGALYFIARAQVGALGPEATGYLQIWKSTDSGATWTRVINDAGRYPSVQGLQAVLVGTTIYIAITAAISNPGFTGNISISRFDTITDAFLADDYTGPGDTFSPVTGLIAWQDGSLLITYDDSVQSDSMGVAWSEGGSFGAPFLIYANPNFPAVQLAGVWLIRETGVDRAYLAIGSTGLAPVGLNIVSIDKPAVVNVVQLAVNAAFNVMFLYSLFFGMPSIWDAQAQVVLPYAGTNGAGNPDGTLRIVRGNLAANPAWVGEAIDISSLPTGLSLGDNGGATTPFPCAAVQQGDTLFVVFTVSNHSVLLTDAQSYLCEVHTTLAAGGWSTPTIIFASPLASDIMGQFVLRLSDASFGVMLADISVPLFVMGVPAPFSLAFTITMDAATLGMTLPIPPIVAEYDGAGTTLTGRVVTALTNDMTANLIVNGAQVATLLVPNATPVGNTVSVNIPAVALVKGDSVTWTFAGAGTGSVFFQANYTIAAPATPPSAKYQSLNMWYLGGQGGAPPVPPILTVNKVTVPGADPGLFNLQIDGFTQAANQGNGGTTGPIITVAGPHQVGETAGVGTILADYVTTYAGDAAPDGSIVLANGDNKVAVIINTRKAVPPPIVPGPISQGGWRREVILIPNHFDDCLAQDLLIHQLAGPRKACCRDLVYYDIINVRAPAASIPFRKIAAIPTPLAASGDVVVLDFQVPPGYDGLIAGCFNSYTGPGFLEGGGDIEWRILINKVYAVQLGQILVTLGSAAQVYPFDGGIQIQSGQRIRYIVNCPNLSGGILPLNSQIVCGLEGLFYARQ